MTRNHAAGNHVHYNALHMAAYAHGPGATLALDLRRIFGDRLLSVVAYGPRLDGHAEAPLTAMALVSTLTLADLEACARVSHEWSRRGIATPLIMPHEEFRESLDAFPLEYGEIVRAHDVLYGNSPFADVAIDQDDWRRACETQVKSHLVHLREGFIDTGGNPSDVAQLITASAAGFAALLRNVARLNGVNTGNRMQVTHDGARLAGLDAGLVNDILALERPAAVPTTDAARLFPAYLTAVEQLARTVDTWRAH
jgi:hypothetical protein